MAELPKDDSHVFVPAGTELKKKWLAKAGCRHCYGRGYCGMLWLPGGRQKPNICRCARQVYFVVLDGKEVIVEPPKASAPKKENPDAPTNT